MQYKIIRSGRKTLALEINRRGEILVRAPLTVSEEKIQSFVISHQDWIRKKLSGFARKQEEMENVKRLSPEEIRLLAEKALEVIPKRVAYYAPRIGVTYGRITIRNQRSRWGSCSQKGNLNFNCLLMLAPPEVLDSVVVHELCHRKEMNHSGRFYEEIYKVFPEYDKCDRWLKENGPLLMRKMTG